MRKLLKFLLILTPILMNTSTATISAPETVVELSIADLIPRVKRVRGLPASYGAEVARVLNSQRAKINDCLSLAESNQLSLSVDISIETMGRPREVVTTFLKPPLGLQDNLAARCVCALLRQTKYPQHPLTSTVSVKLPLSFQRETL